MRGWELVTSNALAVLAFLQLLYYRGVMDVQVPAILVVFAALMPTFSIWYHIEQVHEHERSHKLGLRCQTRPAEFILHCDQVSAIGMLLLLAWVVWQELSYLWFLLLIVVLVPYDFALHSRWRGYVRWHSLWHNLGGLFENVIFFVAFYPGFECL